jgi:LysR family glycine cleavage system transcriptional activator
MRKLPSLGSLRAFEAAARRMSFREAATELGVTPTAVSHQIRLLEDICGQALFRRRPRPLALTGAGERLFPVIRNGFDAFAAAIASASPGVGQRPLCRATIWMRTAAGNQSLKRRPVAKS